MTRQLSTLSIPAVVFPVAMLCGGCAGGSPDRAGMSREEYREVFGKVLQTSFARTLANNLCLPPLFGTGPLAPPSVEVYLDNDSRMLQSPYGRYRQLKALEAAGLLTSVETERTIGGRTQRVATFSRTARGEAYFSGGTFCYARVEFDRIVKWKGPLVLGDYRTAWVYYTVRTAQVADWAKLPAIMASFPAIAPNLRNEPPKVHQVAIDLSSEGWDIAEYSKFLHLE